MGGIVRALGLALALAVSPMAAQAQGQDLDRAAERARRAWASHDVAGLIASSPRLLVQLPGADPSVALGPDQAAALLDDFLAPAQEVDVEIRAAREVEAGRGYVELQRTYRIAGTQELRSQSVLLGYRQGSSGWMLVELRAVGP